MKLPRSPRLAVVALLGMTAIGCKVDDPGPVTTPWTDTFERASIGSDYRPTSHAYKISDGVLNGRGAYNHPLWLRKRLPDNVVIEVDVWSKTSDGDLKVEVFGDGESHARDRGSYTSTGYVLCMGGWNNTKSFIARGSEHDSATMRTRKHPKVVVGKRYHWRIVRRGGEIEWFVDDVDTPFLRFADPKPLRGDGHRYFGFNNWQSDAYFDDLRVTPL